MVAEVDIAPPASAPDNPRQSRFSRSRVSDAALLEAAVDGQRTDVLKRVDGHRLAFEVPHRGIPRAAITVSAPITRMDEERVTEVAEAAMRAAAELGHSSGA
jgi:DNA-binding IclR family transcriptional regulator